jgi:RimJ/RimL family protein N-acetyltransferase
MPSTPTLEGPHIRLEPLTLDHLPALAKIALDPVSKPVIWRYMIHWPQTAEDLHRWIETALHAESEGTAMPWVTVARGAGQAWGQTADAPDQVIDQVIGCTRFFSLDLAHKTVELGHTWIAPAFHGTRANTEAKFLQLSYAFEELRLNRVGLKTHHENRRSQAAIRAIGGVYEGTFRNHLLMPDGSQRDSCWFSFIRQDWPEVKDLLVRRLNAPV